MIGRLGLGRAAAILPALALLATLLFSATAAWAQPAAGDAASPRARLESIRSELAQIETVLASPQATDDQLQRQRLRTQPLVEQLRTLVDEQGPRTEQARLRLEQLGVKPDAKAPPESSEIAREREAREKAFGDADELQKIARATLMQAEQIVTTIGDRRRDLFAKTLFTAGPSILSPDVWSMAITTLPNDLRASRLVFGDWLGVVGEALTGRRGLLVVLAALGAILLYAARWWFLPRIKARLIAAEDSTELRKVYIAWAHLIAGAAPPALASWLVYAALNASGLLPPRIAPVVLAAVAGLALFAFVQALADALFAPGSKQRQVIGVQDNTAWTIVWLSGSLAIVIAIGGVLESWLQAIAAGLSLSIIVRGILALLFAATLMAGLSRLRNDRQLEEDACLGPYVPVDGTSLAPMRVAGWIVGAIIILATLAGYVVFATFLSEQVLWIGVLIGLYVLIYELIDRGIVELLTGDGRLALTLRAGVGIRAGTLTKLAVIVAGLLKVVLIAIALLMALAPWGLESDDFATSLRAAFFGFQVGGVTISLSSIVISGILLALGLAATRSIQGWLEGKFLPTTQLDPGLRNSITTAAGYVGTIAAVALAVSALGLSLERLTLVASALSVGIGFGLQSVVSNFVSGLILLWERPIRVGDQVVVGDAEGIVKRINVRSTEIETFDRASVIVPNSNLVSGVVRNRVRSDRTGRVLISLTVPRAIDPGALRSTLIEAASAHGDVLKTPPPNVLFKKLGQDTMDFDLICVVPEVNTVGRVTSDLLFSIHKRLPALDPPAGGPSKLVVEGLEGIESSIGEIARAIDGSVRTRSRDARPTQVTPPARPRRATRSDDADDEPPAPPASELPAQPGSDKE